MKTPATLFHLILSALLCMGLPTVALKASASTPDTFPEEYEIKLYSDPCIDPSLIDPTMGCIDLWDPVCGCDGVTYSNECYAVYSGGVTSWTPGECGSIPVAPCTDLLGIDFGPCDAVLGYGIADGQCSTISGCSPIVGGVDYSPALSQSPEECQEECVPCIDPSLIDPTMGCLDIWDPVCGCDGVTYSNECYAMYFNGVTSWTPGECPTMPVDPCTDLLGIDFGPCDAVLGYGIADGQCSTISGCSPMVGGVDYSPALSQSPEECQEECVPCIDPSLIDPDMFCIEIYDPVCGCDGVTYPNSCYATYFYGVTSWTAGECPTTPVPADPCTDLAGIDFGLCALFLGYGVVNGQCTGISGCTTVVDGVDYSPAIYPSADECAACTECDLEGGVLIAPQDVSWLCRGDDNTGPIQFSVSENTGIGQFAVIRQDNLSLVAANSSGVFNFNSIAAGQYLVVHVSVESLSQLIGVTHPSQLSGCYALSNFISVNNTDLAAGTLSTESATEICTGSVEMNVSGNLGPNSRFVLLNASANQILSHNSSGVFDFTNRPVGNYRIVHVSFAGSIDFGALQPPKVPSCMVASNQIIITKLVCSQPSMSASPNPSPGPTYVNFKVPKSERVTLELFDMSGRKVAELYNGQAEAEADYRLYFDGSHLPNGVYIYKLQTPTDVLVDKLMITR